MKKEEIIEIQKNLIEIYEKEFRKAGVKYPDDYQTTFIGKKIIKLKSELAELSGQEDKDEKAIAEFDLMDLFNDLGKNAYNAEYHNYHFKEANQIIRKHFEQFASQFQQEDKISDEDIDYCKCLNRSSFYQDKEWNFICSDCNKTIKDINKL